MRSNLFGGLKREYLHDVLLSSEQNRLVGQSNSTLFFFLLFLGGLRQGVHCLDMILIFRVALIIKERARKTGMAATALLVLVTNPLYLFVRLLWVFENFVFDVCVCFVI